jgi:hypothetical protein
MQIIAKTVSILLRHIDFYALTYSVWHTVNQVLNNFFWDVAQIF